MNSAAATFRVQGMSYAVRSLTQHHHQETAVDGTATAHPTSGELRMVFDVVPNDIILASWAYSPHQPLPAMVVFESLDGVSQRLTLELEEAHCVSYEEHFEAGGNGPAAHYCVVSVVARTITKQGSIYTNPWPATNQ